MQAACPEAVQQAGGVRGLRVVDHHDQVHLVRIVSDRDHAGMLADRLFKRLQLVAIQGFVDMDQHFIHYSLRSSARLL